MATGAMVRNASSERGCWARRKRWRFQRAVKAASIPVSAVGIRKAPSSARSQMLPLSARVSSTARAMYRSSMSSSRSALVVTCASSSNMRDSSASVLSALRSRWCRIAMARSRAPASMARPLAGSQARGGAKPNATIPPDGPSAGSRATTTVSRACAGTPKRASPPANSGLVRTRSSGSALDTGRSACSSAAAGWERQVRTPPASASSTRPGRPSSGSSTTTRTSAPASSATSLMGSAEGGSTPVASTSSTPIGARVVGRTHALMAGNGTRRAEQPGAAAAGDRATRALICGRRVGDRPSYDWPSSPNNASSNPRLAAAKAGVSRISRRRGRGSSMRTSRTTRPGRGLST